MQSPGRLPDHSLWPLLRLLLPRPHDWLFFGPACGAAPQGYVLTEGGPGPASLPVYRPLSSPQAFTTSPLSFATKPGVPHRPAGPPGLQAPTKNTLKAEALQLFNLWTWGPGTSRGCSAGLCCSLPSIHPSSQSCMCLTPPGALGLLGPGTSLVPLGLHFSPTVFSFISQLKGHQRSAQSWEKAFLALACIGAHSPLCH